MQGEIFTTKDMKIIFYGLNYSPELAGVGKYSGEACAWLAAQGHDVRVVCAPPYYPEWRIGAGYSGWRYRCENVLGVRIYRAPLYVPSRPRTLTRLLHLLSFVLTSLPVMLGLSRWRPDVVIAVEPTFFSAPGALLCARLSAAKSWLHIQDFELDAMLGLGMGRIGWLAAGLFAVERFIMRGFDALSSISQKMLEKTRAKLLCEIPVFYFPNWVDTDFITPDADAELFRQRWLIPRDAKVVLYSGNLGRKQGLEVIIQAARQCDALFVIVGDGAAKADLMALAETSGVSNVRFYPLQDYRDLPALMRLADVHLVVQKKGVADAVLPSKLTTILSVGGHALITAEEDTELGLLCRNFPGIARCIAPEDVPLFIETLQDMLAGVDVGQHRTNPVARRYALEYLSKEAILTRFESDLLGLVKA